MLTWFGKAVTSYLALSHTSLEFWSCRSLWFGATCLQQVEYWRCFNKMFQVGLMFMMIWNGLYEFVKEVMWKRISNSLHHRLPWCRALLFHRETFKYTKTLSGLQKHPRRTLQNCQMGNRKAEKATACGRCLVWKRGGCMDGSTGGLYVEINPTKLWSRRFRSLRRVWSWRHLAEFTVKMSKGDWGLWPFPLHNSFTTVKFQNTDQDRSIHVERKTPLSPHTSGIGMLCRTWLASDLSICVPYVLVRKLHINGRRSRGYGWVNFNILQACDIPEA